jgi:hypothetical protein
MRKLICVFLLLLPHSAWAGDDSWHWVKAENNTSDWRVLEGEADILVAGDKFHAKLFSRGSHDVQIELSGTIRGRQVTALESVQGTDGEAATYRGHVSRSSWKPVQGNSGVETITLSDGWSMIGITPGVAK